MTSRAGRPGGAGTGYNEGAEGLHDALSQAGLETSLSELLEARNPDEALERFVAGAEGVLEGR